MPTNETKQRHQALRAEVRAKINKIPLEDLDHFLTLANIIERYKTPWAPDEQFILSLLLVYSIGRFTPESVMTDLEEWQDDIRAVEKTVQYWQDRKERLRARKEAA